MGWPIPADCRRYLRAEPPAPDTDRLMADPDPAFGQNVLDIAQAECEAEVQPDRIANHTAGKAMPFQAGRIRRHDHETSITARPEGSKPDNADTVAST